MERTGVGRRSSRDASDAYDAQSTRLYETQIKRIKLHTKFVWVLGLVPNLTLTAVFLVVPTGETIAIVGATGSGKTTLVTLLTRLYDPTDGRISHRLTTVEIADRVIMVDDGRVV